MAADDRGRKLSADADSVGSSSRRSSRAEISPTHHHTGRTYGVNLLESPSHPCGLSLFLQQAQSLSIARTSSTLIKSIATPSFVNKISPAPRSAVHVSHGASFIGAATDPGAIASGKREGTGFGIDRASSHYRHPTAESEDETIPERPPARRSRGTSLNLLRAQETVRRQKEDDADDELAEWKGEDDDEDDEGGAEEDGMDLN